MNKTTHSNLEINTRLLVTTDELKALLGCGRSSAVKIGEDAEARISVGRRVLWCRKKIEKYLEQITV